MSAELLREHQVKAAGIAFVSLAIEIDHLLDVCAIYLDGKPPRQKSDGMKRRDLRLSVQYITSITQALADIVKRWKQGLPQVVSMEGIELYALNELWANIQAVLYFLRSEDINTELFDDDAALEAFSALVTSNRALAR